MIHMCVREEDQVDPGKLFECQGGRNQSLRPDGKEPGKIQADPV